MYLSYRSAVVSDLKKVLPMGLSRYGYSEKILKELLALWQALILNGACMAFVVEDLDQPAGQKQVGWAMPVFATDQFTQEAKTTLSPYVPLRFLEQWRSGKKPFPLKDEIPGIHAKQGLNVLVTHWGADDQRYGPEGHTKIREIVSLSFIELLCRHRVKEFIEEIYGAEERDRLANFGCELRRDFKEFIGTKYLPGASDGKRHPYLMGIDYAAVRQCQKWVGTVADKLARMGPPRFHFRPNDQEVLKPALNGKTDEEIAGALNLSVVAVKKRWLLIYDKVLAKDPELFTESENTVTDKIKQKRRLLLKLLQEHPEELWPNV
jgi:hypothetical protein